MEKLESPKPSNLKFEENQSPEIDELNQLNVCPFILKWTIGMNVNVAIVNLTTRKRDMIAYACSHVVILYDYVTRVMMSLQGHQNAVRSLSASRDGKWLLSADYSEDCVCIVWDTETRIPICSLFNPHGKNSLTASKLSPDAKFLVTVGNESHQVVKLWIWTRGVDEPDATVELRETSSDRVKKISFIDENPAEFILTFDHSVIFVSLRDSEVLNVQRPMIPTKNRRAVENLIDSCYVSKNLAMSVTNAGFVLVWSDRDKRLNNPKSGSGIKRLVKSIPLQKGNLTSIKMENEIIVIGNNIGQLLFYDRQLKLLYWCKNCDFGSIVSISFDRKSDLKSPEAAASDTAASEYNDRSSILDSSDEEEDTTDESDQATENEEIVDEDSEEKVTKFVEKSKEADKDIPKERNNSLVETQQLAASTTTIDIDYQPKGKRMAVEPTDCTLEAANFNIPKFFISTGSGKIAWLDISSLKCRFVLHPAEGAVTAIATRISSDYVVIGNSLGLLSLYKYTTRMLMISKRTPALPDFLKLLEFKDGKRDTSHVTCPQAHGSLVAVSALRFSPGPGEILVCGLESGAIWMLDPNTLDPVDPTPYKHSASKILDLVFSKCGKYLAYSDDAFTVGVFKKNDERIDSEVKSDDKTLWRFLGKYHSHCKPVRQILFGKPTTGKTTTRLFSLGEDRNLVEYDLENSGPYPEPGLKILQIDRVELIAKPSCMTVYPEFGDEHFLLVANSEHKFRLLNDLTKTIRATFRGPTFGDPVQQMLVAKRQERRKRGYMVFATTKEIGLTILPLDGNPHRTMAMIGHPSKIQSMAISDCAEYLFTIGQNDRSVLMWKINYRSVDAMERLGGEGLAPFHSLIEGGKDGWLFNEMSDLFYYAQILQRGENTMSSRVVTDKVSILQLPNLMRAIGFYPTNNELENMMEEISYKNYAETGKLVDDITFDEFVKLYVNHRPAFGITRKQIKAAFTAFTKPDDSGRNSTLTAKQFLEVLFGRGGNIQNGRRISSDRLCGEPLSVEEAHTYLRRLLPQDEDSASYSDTHDGKSSELNFDFLPPNITYEKFTEEILGIGQHD